MALRGQNVRHIGLDFLRGGLYRGEYSRVTKGKTRSLDYS